MRATNQAVSDGQRVTDSRHRPGTRGTESRQPGRTRTRLSRRATVTRQRPTTANSVSNGSLAASGRGDQQCLHDRRQVYGVNSSNPNKVITTDFKVTSEC